MISKKTKNFNLLNHLKQKNLDYKFNYKFFSEKGKPNYLGWYGEFFLITKNMMVSLLQKKKLLNY